MAEEMMLFIRAIAVFIGVRNKTQQTAAKSRIDWENYSASSEQVF